MTSQTASRTLLRAAVGILALSIGLVSLGMLLFGSADSVGASGSTSVRTLRPVTAAGHVASGWLAEPARATLDCTQAHQSPAALSGHVLTCLPGTLEPVACWRSTDHRHAYCVSDSRHHFLNRFRLAHNRFPAGSTAGHAPLNLRLVDGQFCSMVAEASGSSVLQHPGYSKTYLCGRDNAVWARTDADDYGVSHTSGGWSVQVGRSDGSGALHTERVSKAWYVANHH